MVSSWLLPDRSPSNIRLVLVATKCPYIGGQLEEELVRLDFKLSLAGRIAPPNPLRLDEPLNSL